MSRRGGANNMETGEVTMDAAIVYTRRGSAAVAAAAVAAAAVAAAAVRAGVLGTAKARPVLFRHRATWIEGERRG